MTVGRHHDHLQPEFTTYLQGLNLAQSTIKHYIYYTQLFFKRTGKEALTVTKSDILNHLEYLKSQKGQQNETRRNNLISLNHYFTFLQQQGMVLQNPCALLKIRGTKRRSLHRTYTTKELAQLHDNFYQLLVCNYDDSHIPQNQRKQAALSRQRNAVILNILIHQGINTKEIDKILLQDIDLMGAKLRIGGGRKANERTLPLAATQIGVLMHYLYTVRPQFLEYTHKENEKLFLMLPDYRNRHAEALMNLFKPLVKQIKTIDKHFVSCEQIRASVITNWLKTEGLRKTQYLAGHRYVSSTEKYLAGELESLSEDLSKYNPFC